jgi:hypothetical protein
VSGPGSYEASTSPTVNSSFLPALVDMLSDRLLRERNDQPCAARATGPCVTACVELCEHIGRASAITSPYASIYGGRAVNTVTNNPLQARIGRGIGIGPVC